MLGFNAVSKFIVSDDTTSQPLFTNALCIARHISALSIKSPLITAIVTSNYFV